MGWYLLHDIPRMFKDEWLEGDIVFLHAGRFSCTWGRPVATPHPQRFANGYLLYSTFALFVPWWVLTLTSSALAAVGVTQAYTKRRRIRLGRCRLCGYDLRATPGACPECGDGQQNP